MGNVVGAFRSVIEVFEVVVKLITGFPKNIVCLLKLMFLGFFRFVMAGLIPHATVVLIYVWEYWLLVIPKVLMGAFMFLFLSVVWVFDKFFGNWSTTNTEKGGTLGQRARSFVQLFTTCFNDPRAWYINSRYQRGNRHERLLGAYPCMSPCKGVYQNYLGGFLCKKAPKTSPEFCPLAAITRAVDGEPYTPISGYSLNEESCSDDMRTDDQKALAVAACSQPERHDAAHLRTACYERFCANSPEEGVASCVDLVPFEPKKTLNDLYLMQIPVLLIAAVNMFFTLSTSLSARQDEYMIENQQWMAQKLQVVKTIT